MVAQLAPQTEAEIEQLVASGRYADAGEVIAEAVRLLAERDRQLQWLRQEIAIGEEQVRRGEATELTRERFQEIKRRGFEAARNKKSSKDAVKP